MPRAPKGVELSTRLDSLYHDYNRVDSAADPVQRVRPFADPADREIAGFCAGALAFGRVASVLNSIDTLFAIVGPRPAEFVRRFDPAKASPAMRAMVHRWIRGDDLVALLWILRQMLDRSGSIEGFFLEGLQRRARGHRPGARQLFDARAGARHAPCIRPSATPSWRLLFLSPAVCGQRVQAAEPLSPVDGAYATKWTSASGKACRASKLIVPLDTHVIRLGRCLRLTKYTSPGGAWPPTSRHRFAR